MTLARNLRSGSTRVGADEIMRTLKRVDGSGDPEWLDQLAANVRNEPSWELRKIRLAQLDTGETRNPDVIAEYAAMPKESRPPILVLRDGTVVDGGHRAQAAMHNREKTILAYVPVGSIHSKKARVQPVQRSLTMAG